MKTFPKNMARLENSSLIRFLLAFLTIIDHTTAIFSGLCERGTYNNVLKLNVINASWGYIFCNSFWQQIFLQFFLATNFFAILSGNKFFCNSFWQQLLLNLHTKAQKRVHILTHPHFYCLNILQVRIKIKLV